MSGHTKGEWVIESTFGPYEAEGKDNDFAGAQIDIPDATCVGGVHHSAIEVWGNNAHANARLIVAAPDLLYALGELVDALAEADDEGLIEHAESMQIARAAIAKATQP